MLVRFLRDFYCRRTFCPSIFMPNFKCKEVIFMFSDDVLEKFFSDNKMQTMSLENQSEVINVAERILEEIREVNPYATISELFSADE